MKALVTGAAGFIGSHVVRALLDAGHEVRAFHLPQDDLRNLARLRVERFPGDVTDVPRVREAMRGVDWVFHLAAIYALWMRDPARMRFVNVFGTQNVLSAASELGVRRVVHTSSIARFGGQGMDHSATEESPFALGATGDVYSSTKNEAHQVAESFARDGLDVTIVAPCGPIGPGDVGPTPTGRLLLAAVKYPVTFVADTATNFADVRDMARAHVLAAEKGRRGESYLLGTRNLDLAELVEMVGAILRRRRPIVRVPLERAARAARVAVRVAALGGPQPLITPESIAIARLGLKADCSKAVRELGMPQSPIENALADAIEWFRREGY